MAELEVTTAEDAQRSVVALRGELDLSSAARVDAEVERVLRSGAAIVVLDLRDRLRFVADPAAAQPRD